MTKRRGPKRVGHKLCKHPRTRRVGKRKPYTWLCLICDETWEGK